MRYFRGDRLAKMTFGRADAVVHYEEEIVKARIYDDYTIERIKVNAGVFPVLVAITPLILARQLPQGSAEVTLYKLVYRPWFNHIKAIWFSLLS